RRRPDICADCRRQSPRAGELTVELLGKLRSLSSTIGADVGAATGVIARLIEKTPGGRSLVAANMLRDLQKAGLGHDQIGKLLPAIGDFAASKYGLRGFGHLGDLLGAGTAADASQAA
ncbi:MAG: hypothetical protein AAF719_12190, partial [Pseudomonadota bacterium]